MCVTPPCTCVCINCNKRSIVDTYPFIEFQLFVRTGGERKLNLISHSRDGYFAAISRENLNFNIFRQVQDLFQHFVLGKPVTLYDFTSPDCLPTLQSPWSFKAGSNG